MATLSAPSDPKEDFQALGRRAGTRNTSELMGSGPGAVDAGALRPARACQVKASRSERIRRHAKLLGGEK